jgi:acyl phosphate:glycerol-3-phosphate acyltransferase
MKEALLYLAAAVIGYLLGAIPSGQIVGALAGGVDLSQYGSGKTGATNALRTLGWGAAAAVFLGDLAKGIIAVLVARLLLPGQPMAEVVGGFAAVIGHNWSVYIGFKGGRGVVVSMAVFYLLCWPAALIASLVALATVLVWRIVSLASLVGAAAGLVLCVVFVVLSHYPIAVLVYGILAASLVWLRHGDNIQRLMAGTERRIGQKAEPLAAGVKAAPARSDRGQTP